MPSQSPWDFGMSRQDLGIVMANLDNTPGTVDSHGQSHLSHGTVGSHRNLMADLDFLWPVYYLYYIILYYTSKVTAPQDAHGRLVLQVYLGSNTLECYS